MHEILYLAKFNELGFHHLTRMTHMKKISKQTSSFSGGISPMSQKLGKNLGLLSIEYTVLIFLAVISILLSTPRAIQTIKNWKGSVASTYIDPLMECPKCGSI